MTSPRIAVAGAGSIGCSVGGLLAESGQNVRFRARPRLCAALAQGPLRLTDFTGLGLALTDLAFTSATKAALTAAGLMLVAVKSGETEAMARLIADHMPHAQLVSLQNGVGTTERLRLNLSGADVRAAVVPFNVVAQETAHYQRATSGDIMVEAGPPPALETPTLAWMPTNGL